MARTRVFVSSTYYDLKQVRNDLEIFIKSMGYEPILFEKGNIVYGKDKKLETYCYKEIDNTDIMICVIGGKYGSESELGGSITQNEIKTALEQGKQLYVFIDKNVLSEYRTWTLNKNIVGIKYSYVDNPLIYDFIDKVYKLPNNNQIMGFENSIDITIYLKEQWSGLFQRFLKEDSKKEETNLARQLKEQISVLDTLVSYLKTDSIDKGKTIENFMYFNNKLLFALKEKLNIKYNFFIKNFSELESLIFSYGFKDIFGNNFPVILSNEDFDIEDWEKGYFYWLNDNGETLKISQRLFDYKTQKLKTDIDDYFVDEDVILIESKPDPPIDDDDEFPF